MTLTRYPQGPARSSSAGTVNSVVSIFPRNLTDGSCAMTVSVREFGRLWRVPRTFRIVASDGWPGLPSLGPGLDEETFSYDRILPNEPTSSQPTRWRHTA